MTPSLSVRRQHDGSIDLDFYRRRAARQRRLVRWLVLRRGVMSFGRFASLIVMLVRKRLIGTPCAGRSVADRSSRHRNCRFSDDGPRKMPALASSKARVHELF